MLRALTAEQSREVERLAVERSGVTLLEMMRRAGAALAREIEIRAPEGRVVVLAGGGNNGGDGWVAARHLQEAGRDVEVLALRAPGELEGEAASAAAEAVAADVRWRGLSQAPTEADLSGAAVVVDALLGTGARLPLKDPLRAWVAAANAADAMLVAVDVPTGVDADGTEMEPVAIEADLTVTFTAPKVGLVVFPSAARTGELVVADIGIEHDIVEGFSDAPEIWTDERFSELLPLPARDTHKNDRGRVLVIAGSGRYTGSAVLAARGAMRAGAGYVTVAVPEPIVQVVQSHLLAAPVVGLPAGRTKAFSSGAAKAALELAAEYDAVVIGPGLTLADGAVATARTLVASLGKPLVVDADGLNALVDAHDLLERRQAPTVLTPHPGELGRLLGVSSSAVQADRISSSGRLAGQRCTVVLKGAGTVIAGNGRRLVLTSGTPALATAGTGDVLAGIVGALLAQGLSSFEAAALGSHLHAIAGEEAGECLTPMCVTAEDVPEYLPNAVARLLSGQNDEE